MIDNAKHKALEFCKKYKINNISKKQIENIIESMGFTVVEYNLIFSDPDVKILLEELNLTSEAASLNGFTYVSDKYRLVFLNENLADDEKQIVLMHELGHIYCEHFSHSTVMGLDVKEEHEANEFVHYVMFPDSFEKIRRKIFIHKKKVIVSVLIAAVCCITAVYAVKKQSYYGDYYVTESGQKYHEKDCIFVKNKTNIHRLTKEEFETGDYEPCQICLPE